MLILTLTQKISNFHDFDMKVNDVRSNVCAEGRFFCPSLSRSRSLSSKPPPHTDGEHPTQSLTVKSGASASLYGLPTFAATESIH
jgi:hypothetical protein